MTDYQEPQSKIIEAAKEVLAMNIESKKLFFGMPENYPYSLHYVPRLLVLINGQQDARFCQNGKLTRMTFTGPLIHYCSRNALLKKYPCSTPYKAISFSYFGDYIRSMVINFDGIHPPPAANDIFYHTTEPLCEDGLKLIELIDSLHELNEDTAAGELLQPLLRLTITALEKSTASPVKRENRVWKWICCHLRNHSHEPFTRHELAKILQITPGYVSILCKKYSGKSFSELKLSFQFEHAEKLLEETNLNIEEIALNSGFNSSNYFVRRFKRIYGVTPGMYRKSKDRK